MLQGKGVRGRDGTLKIEVPVYQTTQHHIARDHNVYKTIVLSYHFVFKNEVYKMFENKQ